MPKIQWPVRVLAVTEKDQRLQVARRHLDSIEVVDGLQAVRWTDLILRRVRFINLPSRSLARSPSDRRKRLAVKFLKLSISRDLSRIHAEDCLLGTHGPRVLFAPAHAVALIYREHLGSRFTVLELKDEIRKSRLQDLAAILERAKRRGAVDPEPGLTVFTNVRDPAFIRAYRELHPRRTIVLRFHDRIEAGVGERPLSADEVVRMVEALRREGVVDRVESYYREDARRLGAAYRPNGANPEALRRYRRPFRSRLYRLIGGPKNRADLSRFDVLEPVRRELLRLYPEAERWMEEKMVTGPDGWEPYAEYLARAALSEVAVDLTRLGVDEGFSFRIAEALFWNQKIITNRKLLRKEPFYSPDRVFIVGEDDPARIKRFLEADLKPLPPEILSRYDASRWWTEEEFEKRPDCG